MQVSQHTKINFHEVTAFDKLEHDITLARDPSKLQYLAKYCKTYYDDYYKNPPTDLDMEYFETRWAQYQNMISEAIKANAIDNFECLWSAIYFHDRDSPDLLHDVYCASKYANLTTFLHCLYAYNNYHTVNYSEPIIKETFITKAEKNQNLDVLKFILSVSEFFNDQGEMFPIPEPCVDSEDETDLEYFKYLMASNVMKDKTCLTLEEVQKAFSELDLEKDEHEFNVKCIRFQKHVTEFIKYKEKLVSKAENGKDEV